MGKVGSSTMPQKRNPMICENIYANVHLVKNNASLGLEAMVQEHERDNVLLANRMDVSVRNVLSF